MRLGYAMWHDKSGCGRLRISNVAPSVAERGIKNETTGGVTPHPPEASVLFDGHLLSRS
jgi:hypothetical protein